MPMHILIVDDEQNFRFAASIALRRAGYRVTEAEGGRHALDFITRCRAEGETPNLLLLDVNMPGMSGIDLMEELARRGVCIPVVLISGYFDKTSVAGHLRRGFSRFLEKPIEPEELVSEIGMVLVDD